MDVPGYSRLSLGHSMCPYYGEGHHRGEQEPACVSLSIAFLCQKLLKKCGSADSHRRDAVRQQQLLQRQAHKLPIDQEVERLGRVCSGELSS